MGGVLPLGLQLYLTQLHLLFTWIFFFFIALGKHMFHYSSGSGPPLLTGGIPLGFAVPDFSLILKHEQYGLASV